MNESPQSVYRLGAEDGLIMGPLMAVTVLLMGATAYIPGLFFLAIAATLQKAAEARSLPTPIEVSLEMIYMAVFSGSLLSMVLALIVRARRPRRDTPTPPPFNPNK